MAIVIESFTENSVVPGSSLVLTKPAGLAVGDLILIIVGNDDATATAQWDNSTLKPTGFTNINEAGNGTSDAHVAAFWKVADAGDVAASDFTVPAQSSQDFWGFCLRLSGVDTSSPIAGVGGGVIDGTPPISITGITPSVPDSLAFAAFAYDGGDYGTFSTSSTGWSIADDRQAGTGAGNAGGGYATRQMSGSGATGTCAVSVTLSDGMAGFQFAIAPATAGIVSVTPSEFDLDNADIDIAGLAFGASQGTGTVYISDAATLAGSANEVDVGAAITSWSDTAINLDLTALTTELAVLSETLGPGARFIIVETNGGAAEYSSAVTVHRIKAFALAASTNIAAGGAATTAQLTAPAGKTTGDFGGGRIQDDENPADAVDLGDGDYGEWEWALATTLGAVGEETYQFRVLIDGEVASTISVTPQATISGAVEVAAALSGSGALSVSAEAEAEAVVALSGQGALAASALVEEEIAAALSGQGALAASAEVEAESSAALSGQGALDASAETEAEAATALSGGGALSASAVTEAEAVAALSGSGDLTASVTTEAEASVALSGQGALSASALFEGADFDVAAALSGAGVLSISAETESEAQVALSGTGALSGAVEAEALGASSLEGTGALSADAEAEAVGAAALEGQGVLQASVVTESVAEAALSGAGALAASAESVVLASAALSGSGALAASGEMEHVAQAALSGSGDLAVSTVEMEANAAAALSGSGSLAAAAEVPGVKLGEAHFSGGGALDVQALTETESTAALSGSGDLSIAAEAEANAAADLSGAGALSASAEFVPVFEAAASLTGSAQLVASAETEESAAVSLAGSASMSVSAETESVAAAALSGSGIVEAAAWRALDVSAALSGSGAVLAVVQVFDETMVEPKAELLEVVPVPPVAVDAVTQAELIGVSGQHSEQGVTWRPTLTAKDFNG